MFFLFFVAIIVLAMIGLGSVLGTGVGWIAAAVLVPLVLIKILFVLAVFGIIGRKMAGRSSWDWAEHKSHRRTSRPGRSESSSTREERFEEWHRMAHAR
ncbi:MAG: hypothetical protein ACR2OI_12720, partial [Acidimicrobiia bacterium]